MFGAGAAATRLFDASIEKLILQNYFSASSPAMTIFEFIDEDLKKRHPIALIDPSVERNKLPALAFCRCYGMAQEYRRVRLCFYGGRGLFRECLTPQFSE